MKLATTTFAMFALAMISTPAFAQTPQGQGQMPERMGPECVMGRGMMGHGMMGHGGMMGPVAMRIIFALMDSDGDGTVSLQEFQAAHEKIFKAMDVDKDGTLTLEEMQAFMRGTGKSPPQQ